MVQKPEKVEYTVLMICPESDVDGASNAETLLSGALEYLNVPNEELGLRFAPNVTARLERVYSIEEAMRKVRCGGVAQVISLDDEPEKRIAFSRFCERKKTSLSYFVEPNEIIPHTGDGLVFSGTDDALQVSLSDAPREIPADFLPRSLLADPIMGDDAFRRRSGAMVATLAIGVMSHHWAKNQIGFWGP